MPLCAPSKALPLQATSDGRRRIVALGTLTTNVRRLKRGEGSTNVRIVSVETGCEHERLSSSNGATDARALVILMVSLMAQFEIPQPVVLIAAIAVLDEIQGEWEWVTKPDV